MRRMVSASIPVASATCSGRELLRRGAHRIDAFGVLGQRAERDEVLAEEHVHEREQEQRVGGRSDREVLVGFLGGLGAARVDDDETPAARPQVAQPSREVGRGPEAPVRRERIRTEHQEIVGAVDVGNRHRQRGAEHQTRRTPASASGPPCSRCRRCRCRAPAGRRGCRARVRGCARWDCRDRPRPRRCRARRAPHRAGGRSPRTRRPT